ncbi:MAG: hypothetical protein II527_03220 [Bacteroidales bacterium]|nr:hypothetical protein [Bacteroidales bacterium]
MKKLSKILLESKRNSDKEALSSLPSPVLVLFNDVLDAEKVQQSPEIEKLAKCFYGKPIASVFSPDWADQLHDKLRDEQYKADVQGRAMIYPVKADFGDLTQDSFSDQFSGPLYVQIFTPDIADYDILTFTCCWNDGIFRNDYYVVGVIADTEDLGKII